MTAFVTTFQLRTSVLALSILLGACSHPTKPTSQTSAGANIACTLMTVRSGSLPVTDDYPGTVVAEQQIQIASRIMGYVRQINVESGQPVKQGELLITVDPTDIQGQVSMSKATLAQAEATLADAKSDYDRFGELYREEAIPKTQWDKIRLQYTVAQQQANAARAGHATASAQLRYAEIRAPFSGIISQRMTSIGALAAPGQPLLALTNPQKLDVEAQVSEATYQHLHRNDRVNLRIDQRSLTGSIIRLVPSADPVSHTHLVKISLPDNMSLQSGQFVDIQFVTGSRQGLRIPNGAIIERAGITGVFVVDGQHIAHYRMVRTGAIVGNETEIESGLSGNEQIVVQPSADLQSGDHVTGAGNV